VAVPIRTLTVPISLATALPLMVVIGAVAISGSSLLEFY